jgi:hypothetical protein
MLENCFLIASFIGMLNSEVQTVYKYDCSETEKNVIFNKESYKEVKVIKSFVKDSKLIYELKG